MKNFYIYFLMLATIGMASLASCEKEPVTNPDDEKNPVINITSDTMDIAAEGGNFTIEYSITNPHPSITAVVKCDAEWITIIENTNTTIKFSATANTGEQSRSADIIIRYIDTEQKSITVTQQAVTGDVLTISTKDVTYNEFTSIIESKSPDMYYVHYMSEIEYFTQMNIDSAELLIEDDKAFFNQQAGYMGVSLGEFMTQYGFALKGDNDVVWQNTVPAKKYVAYAYGISFNADQSDYTIMTPIYHTIVETPINTISEKEFTIEVTVNGADVEYRVTPNGYDGYYTVLVYDSANDMYLFEDQIVDEAYDTKMAQSWMNTVNTAINYYSMSTDEILEDYCYSGNATITETLSANNHYMLAVFSVENVDGLPMMTSKPVVKNFSTGDVAASDMTFDIEFNYAYTAVVDFIVKPSTDEGYTIFVIKSQNLEGFTTDEEIINWATTSYWLTEYNGEYHYTSSTLSPDSDYSILVFGYHGEVATTGLTRYDFKTEPAAEAVCNVTGINFNGPYDPVAIAKLDPNYASYESYAGYFVLWMSTDCDNADNCLAKYHYLYDTNTVNEWGDEEIFNDLIGYYYNDIQLSVGEYDVEYVIASTVQDYKGNYSDMVYSEPFTYDESQLRDAQEFLDVMNNATRASNTRIVLIGRNEVITLPMRK